MTSPWEPSSDADKNHQRLRCKGRNKKTGQPCKLYAMHGQTVCHFHGGSAKQNRAAGARRWREFQVRTALSEHLKTPAVVAEEGIEDPLTEFKRLLTEVLSWKDEWAAQVNRLEGNLTSETMEGTEQARATVELYERALDRAGKFLDMALKHKLWDRMAEVKEAEAQVMAAAMMRVFISLGLTGTNLDQAKAALYGELSKITETKELTA